MGDWTVLLSLLIFYGHTSSQPLTDDAENVRQTRQLDFGECCPCPGSGQGFGVPESTMSTSDARFALAKDADDCPCRARSSDSEGASSIFMPTSMRPDRNFARPVDAKEDLKPLLHPEVDLASSVLQTLREATDEEYQYALARDAARSVAKEAEEVIFEDAVPEASNGNIVTIIVNPKHADSLEDVIPQETHLKEPRCIHAPLESVNTNLGKMRAAQKPPNLLREIFDLPRISKPTGLPHRNLLDMDNGASNIQEQVVHADDDKVNNKSIKGLRKFAPLMKIDKNIQDESKNMRSSVHDVSSIRRAPDLKLPPLKNKLKDLISNKSAFESKEKVNSLPIIPKMRLNNPLSKVKGKNIEDLSLSPSNIHEQAKKSFFQTKSHLDNILQNTGPVSLKTLLKLKDVELVPLKDLIPKTTARPLLNKSTFVWPDIFKKGVNNKLNLAKPTDILEIDNKREGFDVDVSPSNVIQQIIDDNCKNEALKTTPTDGDDIEPKITSPDIIDSSSSPSEIEQVVTDTSKKVDNTPTSDFFETTDDCNNQSVLNKELNSPQILENSIENEGLGSNDDELVFETSQEINTVDAKAENDTEIESASNDENCFSGNNDGDAMSATSNNVDDILQPNDTDLIDVNDSLVNTDTLTEESSQKLPINERLNTLDNNSQTSSTTPLDKTLSTIKENILRHIENLKKPKTNSNKETLVKEPSMISDENIDSDCQNEESIKVTTVKPNTSNDELDVENEQSETVSMQDLQKMSDEMLQEEQERESKSSDCISTTQKVSEPKLETDLTSAENENIDSEQSANTQNEAITDPLNVINIDENKENDLTSTCQSDLISPKQSFKQESDADVEASKVVMNRTPLNNVILNSPLLFDKVVQPKENDFNIFNGPLPGIQDIQLPPLPTLDDIKVGLTNLFDVPARNVGEHSAKEAASMADTSNVLAPMSSDASAKHFQFKLPHLGLEDVDLDILQLKPQPNLFSTPKLDLHSFKPKLPLPTDFNIKPIKLQSPFEDEGSLLGAPLSLGLNNLRETIPSLENFGARVKANTQKVTKTLKAKPDTLIRNLKSSQGIGVLSDPKNTLKSMSLQSKMRGATIKPVNLQSNDFLETLSRTHEDVNDKLKALHVDFSDRLETMRNNLFDKSIFGSGESYGTKSFSTFSNKNKDKISLKTAQPSLSSRRESKKPLKTRPRLDKQRETRIGSSHGLQNKLKMPAAASVPVPRTIEVPQLKATLTKSPGLAIQRTSGVKPDLQNSDSLQAKESTITLWKQASKKFPITNTKLGKPINPFKDSKIKVSFSTTPRPRLSAKLPSRQLSTSPSQSLTTNLGRNTGKNGDRMDWKGSPSEMKHSIILPPFSSDEQNQEVIGMDSQNRQASTLSDESTFKLGGGENVEQTKINKNNLGRLKSWPKFSESAFLSKVKEAVKARLSHVSSPVAFKQTDNVSVTRPSSENRVLNSNTDMARAASENIDVTTGQALKENVSYKCTMVCTKE